MLIFARFAAATSWQFGSGLEVWAAENLPHVQLLDADSHSDKAYLLQLSEAAASAPVFALWLKSENSTAPVGALAPLLETWLRHSGPKLLVLEGDHVQLERMGRAHSGAFCKGKTAEELKPQVLQFFQQLTPEA